MRTVALALGCLLFIGSGLAFLAISGQDGVKTTDERSTGGDEGKGPLLTIKSPVSPSSTPRFLYAPILSDITTASFRISWVSDQPINASVEYCEYSASTCDSNNLPGSPSVAYDTAEFLQSGAALVKMISLNPGTTYYYRAKARNAANELNYSPNAPPYPSVMTKTSTGVPTSNPTFNVAPFEDKNNNYLWDGEPTDAKQYYFLLYLNHTNADALVSRAAGMTYWPILIDSNNMRDATPSGALHALSSGDIVTFFIAGLYNDGAGNAIWTNRTASYQWMGGPSVSLTERTERTIPELAFLSPVAIASIMIFVRLGPSRRRKVDWP